MAGLRVAGMTYWPESMPTSAPTPADFGPLHPNPNCRAYLLNTNNGIVVHPYDDRGMDTISQNASALAGLYERHNDLLPDYDMESMRRTFARYLISLRYGQA